MTPKRERVFKKGCARELVGIAEGDIESAKALMDANRGRPENVCYHAEQCVEKSLKAILVHFEKAVPFTHDLGIITERVNQFLPIEMQKTFSLGRSDTSSDLKYETKTNRWVTKVQLVSKVTYPTACI